MMAVGMTARTEVPELRRAILLTYYGTVDDSARAVSMDVMTQRVRAAFPGVEVREAFTSRSTANAMRRRSGKPHPLVVQAMKQLEADGYNSITIVSGELIEGKTARLMQQRIDTLAPRFFEVKTTTPLLYTADDCRRVMTSLVAHAGLQADEHAVFVSHGKNGAADDVFCLCDYILQHEGYDCCHVGTIEGYPSIDDVRQILRERGCRRVVLVPLMMVGGGHAKRFVCTTWREALEADGFSVRTVPGGVLDYTDIQDLIIEKIQKALTQP